MNRRAFFSGLLLMPAAPAIVRAESLMRLSVPKLIKMRIVVDFDTARIESYHWLKISRTPLSIEDALAKLAEHARIPRSIELTPAIIVPETKPSMITVLDERHYIYPNRDGKWVEMRIEPVRERPKMTNPRSLGLSIDHVKAT